MSKEEKKANPFQSTPSVWRETNAHILSIVTILFQSTPSVWRETQSYGAEIRTEEFQSTPSVWRETTCPIIFWVNFSISIHSLRMEGDYQLICYLLDLQTFQSTPSVWRETR